MSAPVEGAGVDPGLVVQQAERTASRTIGGKAVVVVIDANELHTLNEVGSRVWELAQGTSLADIAETIASEYEVEPDVAMADVRTFARQLLGKGMLEIVGDA